MAARSAAGATTSRRPTSTSRRSPQPRAGTLGAAQRQQSTYSRPPRSVSRPGGTAAASAAFASNDAWHQLTGRARPVGAGRAGQHHGGRCLPALPGAHIGAAGHRHQAAALPARGHSGRCCRRRGRRYCRCPPASSRPSAGEAPASEAPGHARRPQPHQCCQQLSQPRERTQQWRDAWQRRQPGPRVQPAQGALRSTRACTPHLPLPTCLTQGCQVGCVRGGCYAFVRGASTNEHGWNCVLGDVRPPCKCRRTDAMAATGAQAATRPR